MGKAAKLHQHLKARGNRMTKARVQMIDILANAKSPLTAAEIGSLLTKRDVEVNRTTVYRELDFLLREGLLLEVDLLDGKKRYELHDEDHHHHHLVCVKCNDIRCVELPEDLEVLESKIHRQHKFKVQHHVLEFFGLCSRCQAKG